MHKAFALCVITALSLSSVAAQASGSHSYRNYGNVPQVAEEKPQHYSNNGNKTAYDQMMGRLDDGPKKSSTKGIDAEIKAQKKGAFDGAGNVFKSQ